jgi:hypothetical protein
VTSSKTLTEVELKEAVKFWLEEKHAFSADRVLISFGKGDRNETIVSATAWSDS